MRRIFLYWKYIYYLSVFYSPHLFSDFYQSFWWKCEKVIIYFFFMTSILNVGKKKKEKFVFRLCNLTDKENCNDKFFKFVPIWMIHTTNKQVKTLIILNHSWRIWIRLNWKWQWYKEIHSIRSDILISINRHATLLFSFFIILNFYKSQFVSMLRIRVKDLCCSCLER